MAAAPRERTILCFGDSNTHGSDPAGGPRMDRHTRWPGVLRDELGEGYWIIEEGCGGRTTVWNDPIEGDKNGRAYLPACLHSHAPLDLLVIMLGTNDLKKRFSVPAQDVAAGAGVLVDIAMKSTYGPEGKAPRVLLIAPPPLAKLAPWFEEMFEDAAGKSHRLSQCFASVASQRRCHYLDAREVIVSSDRDGIHFAPEEHRKLGLAVAKMAREILG